MTRYVGELGVDLEPWNVVTYETLPTLPRYGSTRPSIDREISGLRNCQHG